MKKKLFLVFSIICLFFFFRVPLSFADSNFSTDYNVTYTIGANAQTHVNLSIVITNLSNVYFTPSYQIQMGFKNITGLSAYDESGSVQTSAKTDSKGTTINVKFNQRVVGIGRKHTLDISFDTNEVAQNLSHVWEINIPGLSNTSDFNTFNTVVIYPNSLGKPGTNEKKFNASDMLIAKTSAMFLLLNLISRASLLYCRPLQTSQVT